MAIDPRAKPLEERRAAANISLRRLEADFKELFNQVVSHASIGLYLQGTRQPREEHTWQRLEAIIARHELERQTQAEKFSTLVKRPVITDTPVYYNTDLDSARGIDPGKITTNLVSVYVYPIKADSSWSAKSETVIFRLSALLGAASVHVVVEKEYENLRPGAVVSFSPTDYAEHGVYLVFRKDLDDPDSDYLFGWIKPTMPTSIQGIDNEVYNLSDWSVVGYAISVSYGPGTEKRSVRLELDGYGPMSRA